MSICRNLQHMGQSSRFFFGVIQETIRENPKLLSENLNEMLLQENFGTSSKIVESWRKLSENERAHFLLLEKPEKTIVENMVKKYFIPYDLTKKIDILSKELDDFKVLNKKLQIEKILLETENQKLKHIIKNTTIFLNELKY